MTVTIDPEGNETRALLGMADFSGLSVLEIGCGDGRLTWRYADKAAHVTAIDPSEKQIALAKQHTPARLQGRVDFQCAGLEEYAASRPAASFDVALLSWALC